MNSLHFTAEISPNGLVERDFTVGEVTGVLWSPASGAGRAPLVLMGHGGGQQMKSPAMTGRARRIVTSCGFHAAAIDAPGHGGRPRTAHDEQEIAALQAARATGVPLTAADSRITAAVFGLHWPDVLAGAASQITIPIEFDLQWDDEHIDRQSDLALFDDFASKEKTLHANAGAPRTAQVRGRQRGPVLHPTPRPG